MRNQGQIIVGTILVSLGLLSLLAAVFDVDFSAICWPVGLILVGVFLLVRPRLLPSGSGTTFKLLGDVRRSRDWQVRDEEFWVGIGDIDLDLTDARIPPGESRLSFYGFIGDIDIDLPQGVGFQVSSTSFITDALILGEKRDHIFTPLEITSPDYAAAERKVRLEATFFINDIKVRHR